MKTTILAKSIMLGMIIALTTLSLVAQQSEYGNTKKKVRKAQQEAAMLPAEPGMPAPPPPPLPDGMNEDTPPHPMIPGLSDDQKKQMKEIHLKQVASMTPLRNKVLEKTAKLNSVLSSGTYDDKEAGQLADDLGALKASMLKVSIETHRKIRAILTPEQQIIFDSKPKKFLKPRLKR
jgi:Spy/CpxP family protein refolding chaperone